VVTNADLVTQLGAGVDLNHVTYTRWYLAGPSVPEAVLILVPGFGGGAGNFEILAENLITRMLEDHGIVVELWGYDRRTEQLEDRAGTLLAVEHHDPLIALDWYYGVELGFALHPVLRDGPGRRAVFYDKTDDVPFIANWTGLVFSRDLDAVVEQAAFVTARDAAPGGNVFLGGHSAGTGFAARYAATDFDLAGGGDAEPGYEKLRGLVLLEGGGGTAHTEPLSDDSLDRMIAKHDGGLFGAVRDGAPRCVDGTTPCTVLTEAADCAGQTPAKCTPPEPAHGVILGLSPKVLAAAEPAGVQGLVDADGGQAILQVDQGAEGNNAIAKVPDLGLLGILPPGTVEGLFGSFLDDDGLTAAAAPAFAASIGAPGPVVNGLVTWLDLGERAGFPPCPGPACLTPDNGPPPAAIPASTAAGFWGREHEVVRIDRLRSSFVGIDGANASDWYYPLSGLGVTSAAGRCSAGVCAAGDTGAACTGDGDCNQAISLDSTALSVTRGRRDIENLTQAAGIDVPVLAVGGSNGLTSVPGRFLSFATSIGTCRAAACDGTPRVVDAARPNPAFPTFGGVAGGFEVVIAEGFTHMDVVAAEDDADNPVVAALAAFIVRNAVVDR
jgi:pimeloyl-ACP methyl ester carboxylesterase